MSDSFLRDSRNRLFKPWIDLSHRQAQLKLVSSYLTLREFAVYSLRDSHDFCLIPVICWRQYQYYESLFKSIYSIHLNMHNGE